MREGRDREFDCCVSGVLSISLLSCTECCVGGVAHASMILGVPLTC